MIGHTKRLSDFFLRWGSWGQVDTGIDEGIRLTAVVDRHWGDEELNIWGYYAFSQGGDGGGFPKLPAIAIFAGYKQVLVRRLDVWTTLTNSNLYAYPSLSIHLAKLINTSGGYNPVANGALEFVPGWNSDLEDLLPASIVVSGWAGNLQPAQIKGAVVNVIGPRMPEGHGHLIGAVGFTSRDWRSIVTLHDPPLTIRPFEVCYVQIPDPLALPSTQNDLHAAIWLSEREVTL